jgi:hypothetical protein
MPLGRYVLPLLSTVALASVIAVGSATALQAPLSADASAAHAGLTGHLAKAPTPATAPAQGIDKIRHVVIIMLENRSFDSYFGTFPGADGIPMAAGKPAVCAPDPRSGRCVAPYHDARDLNHGGPHGQAAAAADINGGAMKGFIGQAQKGGKRPASRRDGLHDGGEIHAITRHPLAIRDLRTRTYRRQSNGKAEAPGVTMGGR